jgi:8-oxo-dGTP pyrophosphatase MutT (NUDIX family)
MCSTLSWMRDQPQLRHAARVLLLDEHERLLLFRGERPETGAAFWFPAGGGLEKGEDVRAAAVREVAEETGLANVPLGPEVWRRRHVFTWRGIKWDQRERWFMARVAHFEPDRAAMTETEKAELTAARWWNRKGAGGHERGAGATRPCGPAPLAAHQGPTVDSDRRRRLRGNVTPNWLRNEEFGRDLQNSTPVPG